MLRTCSLRPELVEEDESSMKDVFSIFNVHGAPADFLAELNEFEPQQLRAIYLACMPIAEDRFDNSPDQVLWADAKTFVAQCPVFKAPLAELVLLILARGRFL